MYNAELDIHYAEILETTIKNLDRLKKRYDQRRTRTIEAGLRYSKDKKAQIEDTDSAKSKSQKSQETEPASFIKHLIASLLLAPGTKIPIDTLTLHKQLSRGSSAIIYEQSLRSLKLENLNPIVQELSEADPQYVEAEKIIINHEPCLMILSLNKAKLAGLAQLYVSRDEKTSLSGGGGNSSGAGTGGVGVGGGGGGSGEGGGSGGGGGNGYRQFTGNNKRYSVGAGSGSGSGGPNSNLVNFRQETSSRGILESLLAHKSVKDRQEHRRSEEIIAILQKRTAKESAMIERFQTDGLTVTEYCDYLTKEDCRNHSRTMAACPRLHFRRLIFPWTDVSLGNCSYLDTCRNINTCKYIHYELDPEPDAYTPDHIQAMNRPPPKVPKYLHALPEPQWINCDLRSFDMNVLGKFGVIMADPPWEIHQDLPYGTMADDEMRQLNIGCLQDEGVIFLWVTGRAMELGRECLEIWGYKRVDELIWVKTNQLQRLIRTGRTGHWLNHSKEHCLVGVKGDPELNRFVDCDVVVAEVRETSRKPDEMYPLLERLSTGTRKLELFARMHNLRPGWVSLGNQLESVCIKDPEMLSRYEKVYGCANERNT